MQPTQSRIAFIHILRGIAPLLVMWAHLPGWWLGLSHEAWQPFQLFEELLAKPLRLYQNGGHLGVILFFMISGFIISSAAMREGRIEFTVKRIFRIFPALFASVAVMGLAKILASAFGVGGILGNVAKSPADYVTSALMLNWVWQTPAALSVTWSLVAELLFYGIVVGLIGSIKTRPVFATYAMTALYLAIALPYAVLPYIAYSLFLTVYLPFLIIGRALYLLHSRAVSAENCLAMVMINGLAFAAVYSARFPAEMEWSWPTYITAVIVFFAVMAAAPKTCPRPLSFIADISYSLYLVHLPIGMLILSLTQALPFGLSWALATGASIAGAAVMHRSIEVPCQQMARRILGKGGPPIRSRLTEEPPPPASRTGARQAAE